MVTSNLAVSAGVPAVRNHCGPRAFVLRVRGVSMEDPRSRPSFADGDLILVDPDREPRHRSFVIAKLALEQKATFKQLLIEGKRRFLKALNPAWPEPMTEIDEQTTIIGVATFKWEPVLL